MLAEQSADIDVESLDDLVSFEVPVLHPGRTLIEKLLLVNDFAQRVEDQGEPSDPARVARHFYDIHCLLSHEETCDLLADPKAAASAQADAIEISELHFGSAPQPPVDGFGASLAFSSASRVSAVMREPYEQTMNDFYFGDPPHPSFEQVCATARVSRHLAKPLGQTA